MPDRRGFSHEGHGPHFRPPWWPENEPFPPRGPGAWPGMRRRFARRIGLGFVLFFALMFAASALAVGVVSHVFGRHHHRGFVPTAALLGIVLVSGLLSAGRAVRRMA